MAKIQLDREHHVHDEYERVAWEEIKRTVINTGRFNDEIPLDSVSSDFFTRILDAYNALGYGVEFKDLSTRPYKAVSIWY